MNADIRVLLVMKRPGNLRVTTEVLERHGIGARGVSTAGELEHLLETAFVPDLALVDVSGFGPAVWRICARLQAENLPFIVLFQPDEIELSGRSLQYGAMSVLQKPVAKAALLQLVQSLVY